MVIWTLGKMTEVPEGFDVVDGRSIFGTEY